MSPKEKLLLLVKRGFYVTEEGLVFKKDRRIRLYINNTGYYVMKTKYREGEKIRDITAMVHRLQAYQLYGENLFKEGIVVRHLNGDCLDNSKNNIAIGTYSQNSRDIPKEKRIEQAYWASQKLIKYKEEDIIKIRRDKEKMSYRDLAKKYKTTKSEIWYIVNKRKIGAALATSASQTQPNLADWKKPV